MCHSRSSRIADAIRLPHKPASRQSLDYLDTNSRAIRIWNRDARWDAHIGTRLQQASRNMLVAERCDRQLDRRGRRCEVQIQRHEISGSQHTQAGVTRRGLPHETLCSRKMWTWTCSIALNSGDDYKKSSYCCIAFLTFFVHIFCTPVQNEGSPAVEAEFSALTAIYTTVLYGNICYSRTFIIAGG